MQQTTPFILPRSRALWLIMGSLFCGLTALAQQNRPEPEEMVFTVVEHSPEFPGGFRAMKDYLSANVQYPDLAAKANVSGKVFVSFVVERDGQLTNLTLLKGIGFDCDDEALRVVKAMPRWLPGTQSGRTVRVKYNLPIVFGLK